MQLDSRGNDAGSPGEDGDSVGSCRVQLDVFEGPLDLLLYLIRKEEIDIYNIPIARVTDQYLRYLDVMRMLNLNFAGEFLAMAATLLYLKSKMLLPPEEVTDEDQEPVEDPRAELVRQLVEYKQLKDAADDLGEMESRQQSTFQRRDATIPVSEDLDRPLSEVTLFDLLSAFSEALERAAKAQNVHEIIEEQVTVGEQMEMIENRLHKERELLFVSLFAERTGRLVIIVTFLALLELIRLRKIRVVQERPFGEIRILRRRNRGERGDRREREGNLHGGPGEAKEQRQDGSGDEWKTQ